MYQALFRVLGIVALGTISVAAWAWLFFGERLALWWRREYVYAALASVVLVGVAISFTRARRGRSIARAVLETGLTVLGCAGVVVISYLVVAGVVRGFVAT